MEELIDVYDRDGNRTGRVIPRRGAFLTEGQYMLYVLAVIENAEGRFLITQRSVDKRWAAGWWEVSGGGVHADETSADAVVREVGEETGLDVSGQELRPIWRYENVDLQRGDNYIVDIYHFHVDFSTDDVVLQKSEAVDCRLATWEEIGRLDKEGVFLHYTRVKQALAAER